MSVASNIVVPISGVTSQAYDESEGLLLAVTSSGTFYEIDPATGQVVGQDNLGVGLSGLAVSPDGSFALAGETATASSNLSPNDTVFHIDLSSLTSTPITFTTPSDPQGANAGVFGIAVGADANAYVTIAPPVGSSGYYESVAAFPSSSEGSPTLSDINGVAHFYTEGPAYISASETGEYILFAPSGTSGAPLYIYDTGTDQIVSEMTNISLSTNTSGENSGNADISENVKLIADGQYSNVYLFDFNFDEIENIAPHGGSDVITGVHFLNDGDDLLVWDATTNSLIEYDTQVSSTTGDPIAEFALNPGTAPTYGPAGPTTPPQPIGGLQVSTDGQYAFLSTGAGIQIVDLDNVVPLYVQPETINILQRETTVGAALAEDFANDGGTLSISTASNADGGPAVAVTSSSVLVQGVYGQLTIRTDGAYTYVANGEGETVGQTYADTFDLTVTDSSGVTATQTLTFTSTGSPMGDANANIIVGGNTYAFGYPEQIEGLGGADLLVAGPTPDTFLYTSAADSPYSATAVTYDTIEGFRTGTDQIDISAADGGAAELVRDGSETFLYFDPDGSGGYQGLVVVESAVQPGDLVVSSAVADIYDYGDQTSNQVLDGSVGHVFAVSGGAATDTLIGGPSDVLYGGAGADTFVISSAAASSPTAFDVVVGFTSGIDHLDLSAADGGSVEIAFFEGDAFVYFAPSGGAFEGVVEVLGALTPDDLVLSASAKANGVVIQGDTTEAATASETLIGGSGADYIYAGSGHDTIFGGGGADFLVGGAGADTFAYRAITDSTPVAQDLIDNFNPGKGDLIDVSVLDHATGVTGQFVTSFDGHAGEYVLVAPTASDSYWELEGDLTGAGQADFQVAFAVTGSLTDYQSIQGHIHL